MKIKCITIWLEEQNLRDYEKNFGDAVEKTLSPFLEGEPRILEYSFVERSSAEGLAAAGAA